MRKTIPVKELLAIEEYMEKKCQGNRLDELRFFFTDLGFHLGITSGRLVDEIYDEDGLKKTIVLQEYPD